jgi:hypothetical protein
MTIDTADHVRHGPTGEEWVVAYVKGDRLAWCGWPQGEAALSDCTLTKKATPEERDKLLRDLAAIREGDMRADYARQPMTDEQIDDAHKTEKLALIALMHSDTSVENFTRALRLLARAVERAHGIGGSDEQQG